MYIGKDLRKDKEIDAVQSGYVPNSMSGPSG
jgi:hypothetical protein